jgi:hypothetical protein
MAYVVNTTITEDFDLIDNANVPIVGADLDDDFTTAIACLTTDTSHTRPVTLSESVEALAGLGKYAAAFTPDLVSNDWSLLVIYDKDGVYRRWTENFSVVSVDQAMIEVSLVGSNVTLLSPLSLGGGALQLIQGDSYAAAQSRQIVWNLTGQPDLTGATVTLTLIVKKSSVAKAMTVTNPAAGSPTISATLTKEQTASLEVGVGAFDASATIGSDEITLIRGRLYVEADV